MKVVFLAADVPLTKSFTKNGQEILKTPYPFIWEFTSSEENIPDLPTFERSLRSHARLGHSLLKGQIAKPLVQESRAGSTTTNDMTDWAVLDLDGIPQTFNTIDVFLNSIGLGDISYVIQWSASYGITDKLFRAHIFFMLERPVMAPLLKQWLTHINHANADLKAAMQLTKTGCSIRWPLDISACQNDKLIYIAPPVLKGMKDPVPAADRIQYVKKKKDRLAIAGDFSTDKNRELTHKRIAELRADGGYPKLAFKYKMHGAQEVMLKPGQATITEMKRERGFVYFNLNGGDSWAYYHPENNPDLIMNFKGEPAYLTKELLPDYWADIVQRASNVGSILTEGKLYLAFCDRRTAGYWIGTYEPATDTLDIHQAKNSTQVRDYAKQVGLPIGDFIPVWDLEFDPHSTVRVDPHAKIVNTFNPSPFMKAKPIKRAAAPKTIMKVIEHALGNPDKEVVHHFLNWLAFIIQKRDRTRTAWVLHGTEGCLAGDTVIDFRRGKRNAGRPLTIKEAFEKWTGQYKLGKSLGKSWDLQHTTFAKAVKDGMTIGFHEVYDIVEAGVKRLYKLTTASGRTIRVTNIHPFLRPDGSFTKLKDLQVGDLVVIEGVHNAHVTDPQGRKKRSTTYSIPHHPYAWEHWIAGRNYKRSHTARLIVEADMNDMSLDDFVNVLRRDAGKASQLKYLPRDVIVHHEDENPSNDALANLKVVDKDNHDRHHAREVGLGTISTLVEQITHIEIDMMEMTYDMTMKAPYQNYVANGFVVHNTGKGILCNNILRPIIGPANSTSRRMEELNEQYNHFMRNSFLVVVDEVQTKALQNERGAMAKLRNFITESMVAIRQMYANGVEFPNYTNWIFNSNMPDPVAIPKNDRRFNVAKYQQRKLAITQPEIDQIEKELQHFHDYLFFYTMNEEQAAQVIQTADRDTMISISETSIDTVADAILKGDFEFLIDQLPAGIAATSGDWRQAQRVDDYKSILKAWLQRTDAQTGVCNIAREELRGLFEFIIGGMPGTPNKFTSLLKHHRIHIGKVWLDNKTVNGLKITWMDTPKHPKFLSELVAPAPAKVIPIAAARGKSSKSKKTA